MKKEWTNGMEKISREDFLELCRKNPKFPNIKAKEMKEYIEDEIGLYLSLVTVSNKLTRAKFQIKKEHKEEIKMKTYTEDEVNKIKNEYKSIIESYKELLRGYKEIVNFQREIQMIKEK